MRASSLPLAGSEADYHDLILIEIFPDGGRARSLAAPTKHIIWNKTLPLASRHSLQLSYLF